MVRPLTKRKADGALYARPRSIEQQIAAALALDAKTVLKRAEIDDESGPDYLSCECLVHLIRDANRRNETELRNRLLTPLLNRCGRILLATIPDGRKANAAHLRDEVLGRFGELVADDCAEQGGELLDFYECKFNKAFKTLRLTLLRSERNATKHNVELPGDEPSEPNQKQMAWLTELFSTPASQEDAAANEERRKKLCDAIETLPADDRAAIALHYFVGLDVESEDPEKATVAKFCGVSGRTIRTRLARAYSALKRSLEEEP